MGSTRSEWQGIRAMGLPRFMLRGALRHGIPMTIAVVLLLELFAGTSFTRERATSAEFIQRVVLCLVLFGASGAISSYARWRTHEALFGDRDLGDPIDRGGA